MPPSLKIDNDMVQLDNDMEQIASSNHQSLQISKENLKSRSEIKELRKRKPPNSDYITQEVIDRYIGSNESITTEHIRLLLRDSRDSILKKFHDNYDYSNSPSFSKLTSPYHLICRERFRLTKKLYEHQFQREIKQLVEQQTKASDAVCFVRVMALTSLWPPLHTRRNLDHTHQQYFQLTPKQKKRLAFIMGVDWSKT